MKYNAYLAILVAGITVSAVLAAPARRPATPPATPNIEELPRRPMDTIATPDPDTKVIIFSNNTWEYYRPDLKRLDALPIYRTNWDTATVFAYRSIALEDLPQVVNLQLTDSLNNFCIPVKHGRVTSKYGPRGRRNHNGIDIPMRTGEPVLAAFDGKVRYSKYNTGGFGNLVILRHPNGLETWYAHFAKRNVEVGDYVKSGQVIGYIGATGRAYGAHLHFECRYYDQSFDPEFLIDFEHATLRSNTFALNRTYFNIHSRASELLEEDGEEGGEVTGPLAAADQQAVVRAAQPKPAAPAGPVYHTVKNGDILGRIAQRYGTTITRICELNKINRESTLRLGQRLRVK